MQKLNNIFVANDATATSFREGFGRKNLPMVVRVVMAISSDLLACRSVHNIRAIDNSLFQKELTLTADTPILVSKGISFDMGVQVNFGLFMSHDDGVVKADFCEIMITSPSESG